MQYRRPGTGVPGRRDAGFGCSGSGDCGGSAEASGGIELTLTSKGCPAHTQIIAQIEGRLSAFETISGTTVDLVWEPAWSPQRISAEGRKTLGID